MAKSWKEVDSEDEVLELEVKLRPMFGLSPQRYVPIVAVVALAALAFALLVLPGILRFGSEVSFTTSPAGASVRLDGRYVGTAPLALFVPSGRHEVAFQFGAAREVMQIDIPGRRLFSLFAPSRLTVEAPLRQADSEAISEALDALTAEFAAFSLMPSPSDRFQHPPSATLAARSVWALEASVLDEDVPFSLARDIVAHAAAAQSAQVSSSLLRLARPGAALTPGNIADAVSFLVQIETDYPGSILSRTDVGEPLTDAAVWNSAPVESYLEEFSTELLAASLALDESAPPRSSLRSVGGLTFASVPAGRYIVGYPLRDDAHDGRVVDIDAFEMLTDEVSNGLYAEFVLAESGWQPGRRDQLADAGLTTSDYLSDWPDDWQRLVQSRTEWAALPVRYVSWHAAAAFADWLARRLGTDIRLPSAAQFEYAAFLSSLGDPTVVVASPAPVATGGGRPGALGTRNLLGNLWEWTADWYSQGWPNARTARGDQRIVAGGAYSSDDADHRSRGQQPPDWSTAFLGFRVVRVNNRD